MALTHLPRTTVTRRLIQILLALIGISVGAWLAFRGGVSPPVHIVEGEGPESRHAPPLVWRGNTIFIPEGSPYRGHVAVAPVQTKSVNLSRIVTGTVEADPARTVKILAPVNGRVGELKVELGDNVKKGQPLATIDSGDLAQAVADAEKARASVKLTKSAVERATGLNKAGGRALRDLEQAQNDYL